MRPEAADDLERRVAAYYDREGARRLAMPMGDVRTAARDAFVALLAREGRRTLLEVGSGPGRDATAFGATAGDRMVPDTIRPARRQCPIR